MNCTICGQATLPGAMLCRPCKAALKRARYLSVQDLPRASILRPRRSKASAAKRAGPGAVAASAAMPVEPEAARARSSSARQLLLGAGAITALALVAYFGQRHTGAGATDVAAPGGRDVPVVLTPLSVSPPAAPLEPAAPVAAPPAVVAAPDPSPAPAYTVDPTPAPKAARVRSPAPRPEPAAVAATVPRPEIVEPVAPPPAPAPPPPAPVPRPAPPPDRWQSMSNALAQCAREGGFGGFVCDQKVRLDSCEGYWGRVPQCPLPPENPGGQ